MREKEWFRKLFRQRFIVAVLIILQIALLIYLVSSHSRTSQMFGILMTIISFFVSLYIASEPRRPVYKIAWIFLILVFPLFGGLLYLLLYFQTSTKRFQKRAPYKNHASHLAHLPGDGMALAKKTAPDHLRQIRYLQDHVGYPVYSDTKTKYLSPGEAAFPILLEELEKAKRYIFLEFFIIQEGVMWDSILEILKKKVKEGVKVRLLYDDIGCLLLLPKNYPQSPPYCNCTT